MSITGHGRYGRHANRVAFGDDAAASGGLGGRGGAAHVRGRRHRRSHRWSGRGIDGLGTSCWPEGRAALVDVSLAAASAWAKGCAGSDIERPVVRGGKGWAVELSDRLVAVRPPTTRGIGGRSHTLNTTDL